MTVSQVLNHINDNSYDDDITVKNIPEHSFIAVTGMRLEEGGSIRDIRVDILPLPQETRPTQTINSGLFVRLETETAVKVTVYQDNKAVAENKKDYY